MILFVIICIHHKQFFDSHETLKPSISMVIAKSYKNVKEKGYLKIIILNKIIIYNNQ